MKKNITLFLIIFSLNTIKSQITYFNYLDYTSEWRNYSSGWNGWCCIDTYYSTTYFDGDTTINNNQYYKRYTITVHNNLPPTISGVSMIREDANGSFLSYSPSSGLETIFFDNQLIANSQIGDPFPYPGAACTVEDIDTVSFDSKQLKHIYGAMTQLYTGSMEGVGVIGLACVMGVEGNGNLSCYSKQGNTITFGSVNCNLFPLPQRTSGITGIINKDIEKQISIYPNPTNSILTISDEKNQFQNAVIELKNTVGQIVQSIPFSNQINMSDLPSGIYFLTIQGRDCCKTVKVIKE